MLAMSNRPPRKRTVNAHRKRRRPGWFRPVPLRARADGWSETRQCEFLCALYATGSVAAAARAVGMSKRGAFRLRRREGAESFAAAWDRVLTSLHAGKLEAWRRDFRKVTLLTLNTWVETGFIQPVIYRGALCGIRRKPDDSALFPVLRRLGKGIDPWIADGFEG